MPWNVPVAYAAPPLSFSTSTAEQYIRQEAGTMNVSAALTEAYIKTLRCESGFDPAAIGPYGELGIAQIYLKKHPEITRAQALDPVFAIHWSLAQFLAGRAHWWSCYNLLHLSLSDRE